MSIVFALVCCLMFGFFSVSRDALLCFEVVCKSALENGILAMCEVFFWSERRG